ncbi:MAG: polysaccharide biosynthesis protein, partial [Prevotella sp.]|nr:polysaccharide biosynthesis protein [Prevotella sp.]
ALPYWCVLLLDCGIVMLAGYIGFYSETGGDNFAKHFWQLTSGLTIVLIPFLVSFRVFRTYSGIIRYSSFVDLQRVVYATLTSSGATLLLSLLFDKAGAAYVVLPSYRGVCIVFCVSTFLMWLERVIVKRLFDEFKTDGALPAAIYGTKAGGIALSNSLINVKVKHYTLKCFISDGREMEDTYLMGKPVYLNGKGIAQKLTKQGVKVLLVSPLKNEKFRNNQQLVDEIISAGIRVMMMPSAEVWDGKSNLSHSQLHEVEIEDLLPRDKIDIDMDAIGTMLCGKRVLITGAAGSIGSEMARQVAKFNLSELILVDQAETPMHDVRLYMARNHKEQQIHTIVGSICNQKQMETIFREHTPEYVFHAAAYKHVPMMEDNPAMAVQNNVYGTRVIADLAVKYGTKKFVMISTDKAVNPTNVMGCSKRICEIYCQALNKAVQDKSLKLETVSGMAPETQFITTRFGNVLGSNGSVIPIFKEQIKKGGPVMVTHPDIIRYFMLIPEACRLVLEAGTMGKGGEIFVFDMGQPVKIVDLAKRMITLSGAKDIEIQFSGLRDGEKLFEELLATKENTKPTVHPKIMVASVREYPYDLALKNEIELHELSESFDDMAIVKKMKEIVPEYKSMVSKYQVLDE